MLPHSEHLIGFKKKQSHIGHIYLFILILLILPKKLLALNLAALFVLFISSFKLLSKSSFILCDIILPCLKTTSIFLFPLIKYPFPYNSSFNQFPKYFFPSGNSIEPSPFLYPLIKDPLNIDPSSYL